MKLILDQGNTLLKIALFNKDQMLEGIAIEEGKSPEILNKIYELEQKHHHLGKIDSGIISTVKAHSNELIGTLSGSMEFFILNARLPLPIKLLYKTPDTLGNDRIALATGGAGQFPGEDVMVIDAGTCITYDFINRDKEYLGGAISPGISMRFRALNNFTSKLPLVSHTETPKLIGDTTATSIQSGVINGVKAEVMGIINQYLSKYPSLKIIFTGGDLKYFDKSLKNNIFANSNLILLGLKEILEYNAKL